MQVNYTLKNEDRLLCEMTEPFKEYKRTLDALVKVLVRRTNCKEAIIAACAEEELESEEFYKKVHGVLCDLYEHETMTEIYEDDLFDILEECSSFVKYSDIVAFAPFIEYDDEESIGERLSDIEDFLVYIQHMVSVIIDKVTM